MSRLVATIRKNRREDLRVSIDHYRGHELVSLRVWFEADDGTMRPGKQGIALRLDLLPDLQEALEAAATAVSSETTAPTYPARGRA
jgi:hypothetical protein